MNVVSVIHGLPVQVLEWEVISANISSVCFLFQDVGIADYHHHSRDYNSHMSHGAMSQPYRRRPSLLSEFQPGNERYALGFPVFGFSKEAWVGESSAGAWLVSMLG